VLGRACEAIRVNDHPDPVEPPIADCASGSQLDRGDFQKMVDAQIEETLGWAPR